VYYYEIKDQQLSAIGGGGNFVQLVNADKGVGMGFDLDGEFLITDRFLMTLGFSYTDTSSRTTRSSCRPAAPGCAR
jgi:outer membrane receptor protein involved in Fe transport